MGGHRGHGSGPPARRLPAARHRRGRAHDPGQGREHLPGGAQAVGAAAQELRVPLPHEELAADRQRGLRPPGQAAEHPAVLSHPRHVQPLLPGAVAEEPHRERDVLRDDGEDQGKAPAAGHDLLRAGHRRRHGRLRPRVLRDLRRGGQPRLGGGEPADEQDRLPGALRPGRAPAEPVRRPQRADLAHRVPHPRRAPGGQQPQRR